MSSLDFVFDHWKRGLSPCCAPSYFKVPTDPPAVHSSPSAAGEHLRPELGLRAQGGLARLAELLVRGQRRGRLALRALEVRLLRLRAGLLRFRVAAARHEARDVALQRQQLLVQLVQALLVRPDLPGSRVTSSAARNPVLLA